MNMQNQNMPGNVQAASTAQISQQQMRDAYWNAPLPYAPTSGPAPAMPAVVVNQDRQTKANTFSKLSVAFIVLGLVLLGASIVPFVVYFDLPAALGVLAFDTLLMASALVFTMLGINHSSQLLRRTGLIIALCTVVKMMIIDTWEFDPLTKAIAYVVGGAVCFAIGAIYSAVMKRIAKEGSDQQGVSEASVNF